VDENSTRAAQDATPGTQTGRNDSVSATADRAGIETENQEARHLGFQPGQAVQEIGWDEDVDEDLRVAIEEVTGGELVDEDNDDVVDVVLLWYRGEDGDLVDVLVDALGALADGGHIWLLTPKAGREGHVEPSEIGEAAPTAGLAQTSSVSAGHDWAGTRLVAPKAARVGRR
jgi:Protein of unknown function (DUF3052)